MLEEIIAKLFFATMIVLIMEHAILREFANAIQVILEQIVVFYKLTFLTCERN